MLYVTAEDVLESIDNAWRAIAQQYQNNSCEELRCACNLLGKICAKVRGEANRKNKGDNGEQISIDEWIKWLNS